MARRPESFPLTRPRPPRLSASTTSTRAARAAGPRAEEEPAGHGHAEGEEGHPPVEAQIEVKGKRKGGQECVESRRGGTHQGDARETAEGKQDEGLRQQGTGQIGAVGTERGAHRHLAAAEHAAGEHQAGDVHRRHEQDERADHGENGQETQHGPAEVGVEAGVGSQGDAETAMALGILARQVGGQTGHLGLRGGQTHSLAEPAHELQAAVGAVVEVDLGSQGGGRGQRQIEVQRESHEVTPKPVLGHAYEGEGMTVDAKGSPEHVGPASEAPLPQRLADDGRGLSPAHVVGTIEQPSEARARAEQLEEPARYELAAHHRGALTRHLRRLVTEDEPLAQERLDPRQRSAALLEVEEGRVREAGEAVVLGSAIQVEVDEAGRLHPR